MHRMHCLVWLAFVAVGPLLTGCGSSNSTATVDATVIDGPSKDARDPKQVVTDFLDLKQKGNHLEADKLLSEKACEITRQAQLSIVEIPPDGSVRYEVNASEMVPGGAHVLTTWTLGQGETAPKATMLFVMREDAPGWRIVGVIMRPPGEAAQPVALDFEDEQQIRSYIAAQNPPQTTAPQGAPATSEQQATTPETATKPSSRATKKQ